MLQNLFTHANLGGSGALELLLVKSCVNIRHGQNVNVPVEYKQGLRECRQRERLLLCEDNGDGIVEDALTEHQHVEDRVYVQGVEDGDGSDRVHG